MSGLIAIFVACDVVSQALAVLQPPRNLAVTSESFKHILTWEDPNNASAIYYSVQSSEMHYPFEMIKDCFNITTRRCDLTKHLSNVSNNYRLRVLSFTDRKSSRVSTAFSLTPVQDTTLGPPIVDVIPCDRCINVSIQPPVSHLWSKKQQQYVSLFNAYGVLYLRIQLMHMSKEVSSLDKSIHTESDAFTIPNLLPNANYCVSVTATASVNKRSVPSKLKCVVTEYHGNESSTELIVSVVVVGVLLLILLFVGLIVLDCAGYICRAKTLIPKVLKSFPTSESMFIDGSEFTSPTYSSPVDIINKKIEVEQKPHSENKNCEGGYASRKRLEKNDTSGTATSGESTSAVSSSMGSSDQANSSAEEDFSVAHQRDGVSELGSSSMAHLPVSATEDSSNLPFDTSGVFNINLNTVSTADPANVWTGFSQVEAPQEEAEDSPESHEAGIALDQHKDICLGVVDLEEEYCSDYEEEEDLSENDDSDSHLISGYMRR